MKTKNGHRRLFSVRGDGGDGGSGCRKPWRPRAASTSDIMPLHRVHRPGGTGHHGSPYQHHHATDPADADDASHKGIVRTVAVAVEWDVAAPPPARRPLSTHSARTDWLVPVAAAAAATTAVAAEGAKGGGFYANGEENYTRRIVI